MVLVHKLKQMEELDIEQFREPLDDEMSNESSPTENNHIVPKKAPPPRRTSTSQRKRKHSPPRRPITRSQTGHVPKRRRADDEDEDEEEPYQQTPPPPPTEPTTPLPESLREGTLEVGQDVQDTMDETAASTTSAQTPGQLTFMGTESDSASQDRRGPRSRAVHPVPVPNLTKKSRGRRVPTKTVAEKDAAQKSGRLYVCKVEDCGKCFNRGEHLKRHIRSIHTHEKPFKCSHQHCDKFFNRHDNLLQHLKVHKDLQPESSALETHGSPQLHNRSIDSMEHRSHSPEHHTTMTTPAVTEYQTPPPSLTTNMAISSLRTELRPTSPAAAPAAASGDAPIIGAIDPQLELGHPPTPPAVSSREGTIRPHYRRKYEDEAAPLEQDTQHQSPPPLLPAVTAEHPLQQQTQQEWQQ